MWLATVSEACRRTSWWIYAWALMSNHYHLLLETLEANLVSGMIWLKGTYTQRYTMPGITNGAICFSAAIGRCRRMRNNRIFRFIFLR
jgi:REP element-mobilizing transposase RayT